MRDEEMERVRKQWKWKQKVTNTHKNNIERSNAVRKDVLKKREKGKTVLTFKCSNSTPSSDIICQCMSVIRNGVNAEGKKKAEQTSNPPQNQQPDHCMHPAQSASKEDLRPISTEKPTFSLTANTMVDMMLYCTVFACKWPERFCFYMGD